ncbi:ThiF family adenylyltransferase [Lysobacter capsici]|uniref:ThiF family adenylyltransferase n=1 Tax=Lysobacter capsici TaxID=435897 RepID=UPI000BBAE863|nr:ThiF family adenylyltransferase [Lysobacter capsici]ATE72051.1 hypothetical protein CNO08_12260 [Lysobacter capsici]
MLAAVHESAIARVRAWLDTGAGSRWVNATQSGKGLRGAWEIPFVHAPGGIQGARLVLPATFPTDPCQFYVDPRHFLEIPHVEADGHVCLGLSSYPSDYDDPEGAVVRALKIFQADLLRQVDDPAWREEQFHLESGSYWAQWCLSRESSAGRRPMPRHTYVDFGDLGCWKVAQVVGYARPNPSRPGVTHQVVAAGAQDPNEVATRHGWAKGMMIRGDALLVRLPSQMRWTPQAWPASLAALERLIAIATDNEVSLSAWLKNVSRAATVEPVCKEPLRRGPRRQDRSFPRPVPTLRPTLVVLIHDGLMFGYQLFPPMVAGLTTPVLEPLRITRIDPDWALARDYQPLVLRTRRERRVLLLGCGSLGSPLAKALARSGVGHIDLVDAQLMESENISRHELGLSDVAQPKADALAQRLRTEVPGLSVQGHYAEAQVWTRTHCHPGAYDLVVECTAESAVRTFLSHARIELFGAAPVIHAWVEPLCSAGHVVLTQVDTPWPAYDPADSHVNASDLSGADTLIKPPACSSGFHPYAAADIQLIAAFVAERVIGTLDEPALPSTVWSWVRSSAFFEGLGRRAELRAIVPRSTSRWDSAAVTRDLAAVLGRA